MKNKKHFLTVFAIGVVSGFLVHGSLVKSQSLQSAAVKPWADSEEDTLVRMAKFQDGLEKLMQPNPDSVDTLSKEMDAQRSVYDILSKYREAQQAKFVSLQTIAAALVAAAVSLVTTLLTRRISKSR